MRFEELLDDNDDDEWATALIRAAEAAEEAEWEWRIAMARARADREEPQIAKLAPPQTPALPKASPPPSARKGASKPPPIPPLPPRPLRAGAPPLPRPATAPVVRAASLAVSPPRGSRPTVFIPPKEPRRPAPAPTALELYEASGELLRDAFATYVIKEA